MRLFTFLHIETENRIKTVSFPFSALLCKLAKKGECSALSFNDASYKLCTVFVVR